MIGEEVNRLSEAFIEDNPQVPWRAIVGTRNIIIHGYFDVNADTLWDIITDDLPQLKEFCNSKIQALVVLVRLIGEDISVRSVDLIAIFDSPDVELNIILGPAIINVISDSQAFYLTFRKPGMPEGDFFCPFFADDGGVLVLSVKALLALCAKILAGRRCLRRRGVLLCCWLGQALGDNALCARRSLCDKGGGECASRKEGGCGNYGNDDYNYPGLHGDYPFIIRLVCWLHL